MSEKNSAASGRQTRTEPNHEDAISRREFVGKTLAAAPALAMTKLGVEPAQSTSSGPSFSEPREIRSVDGVIETTLTVEGGLHRVTVSSSEPTRTAELRLRTCEQLVESGGPAP